MKKTVSLILILLALLVAGCQEFQDSMEQPSLDTGKAGEKVTLFMKKPYVVVFVQKSLLDHKADNAMHGHLIDLEKNGSLMLVEKNTPAKVLEVDSSDRRVRKVKILKGKYKGQSGYVSYLWMRKFRATPTPKKTP